MEITTAAELLSTLKDKHLLIDTSVFIDTSKSPSEFRELISKLKSNGVVIVTLDVVKIEFLRGSIDSKSYKDKEELMNDIIDSVLPVNHKTIIENLYKLTQQMKEDGKSASIIDLFLGATLMCYKKNLFLLTKNSRDFPTNIFSLSSIINISKRRTIQCYGVYNFKG